MGKYVVHNASGYVDPTMDVVLKNDHKRRMKAKENTIYYNMRDTIKRILENNGYELEGPISLINMANGRKRRIY